MDNRVEIVLLIVLLVCSIEDLIFKKLRIWELVVGTIVLFVGIVFAGNIEIRGLFPGIVLSALFFLVSWMLKGNLGWGDSWVIGMMGLGLDFQSFVLALGMAFLLAAVVSGIMIFWKKSSRKATLPFVPFLLAGFLMQLMV